MPYFVVVRERSSGWDWSLPMRQQSQWEAHAAFMDAATEEGFIVAGGPLGDENHAKRVLHVVRALDTGAIEMRLAQDPWTHMRLLKTISVEPWTVLLGSLG
ncbi:MAG: hypothetical protein JO233_04790, partial [Candidatus Eremiobacteraeota bacterium]|nr:hypothetical protein [Candidatus Eremiobacteraeota bacterium]